MVFRCKSCNDDSGDDARLAIRVALGDGVRAAPDFQHAPQEAEHEHDPERGAETLLKRGGRGGLREDKRTKDGMSAERR